MAIAQEIVVKVSLDDKRASKGLARLDKSASSVSKSAGGVGKAFKAVAWAAVAAGAVKVSSSMLKLASSLEESENAINVVFGEGVGLIRKFGDQTIQTVGLTETEFNKLSTSIGSLFKNAKLPLEQTAEQTIELTKRAADLASVFDTEVSEAANALGAALRGESEPARRFGVTLSDAAVQAKALEAGLANTKSEITEQVKVQARYLLIMEQSNQVAGDFANTQGSFSNQMKIAGANTKDLGVALGQKLLPAATKVLTDAVNPSLAALSKWVKATDLLTTANEFLADSFLKVKNFAKIKIIETQIASLTSKIGDYQEMLDDIEESRQARIDLGQDEADVIRSTQAAYDLWKGKLDEVITEKKELTAEAAKLSGELDNLEGKVYGYNRAIEEVVAPLKNVTNSVNENNKAVQINAGHYGSVAMAMAQATQHQAAFAEKMEEINSMIPISEAIYSSYGGVVTGVFSDIGAGLVGMAEGTTTAFQVIAEAAKQGVATVLDALAREAAAKATAALALGLTPPQLGGNPAALSSVGPWTAAAAGASVAAGVVRALPVPELANGGVVPATPGGRIVKVAEAGQDEAIIPLDKAGFGPGGGVVIINNTNVAGSIWQEEALTNMVFNRQQRQLRGF